MIFEDFIFLDDV